MADINTLDKPTTQRFRTGIEYQKELLTITRSIQKSLLDNLPSNYSKDQNTNLAEFFRVVAKEFARLQISNSEVNENKYHAETKAEYLFQILGDSLFLGEKSINENIDDISYRNFLIKVRNAYFGGSRKDNIESAVSDILDIPVTIKEVYLNLREDDSFYSIEDTHKMFFNIVMDNVVFSNTIGLMLEDIKFFIDLIKPAHVIYDTCLIWNDEFRNKDVKCKPSYITQNMDYEVYGTDRIYLITFLATKIIKFSGSDPSETWEEGIVSSVDHNNGIFILTNGIILVYNSDTLFYRRDGDTDLVITPSTVISGDVIKYYATKDSSSTSDVIEDSWEYSGIIQDIYPDEETIYLVDGSIIVYNSNTLVYTRDYNGEYRINISDLWVGSEILFKADKYTKSFQFYLTPEEIQDNFFKQFDSEIIIKPSFQELVKKNKDIPEGFTEGYTVVIENGVATIKKISSKFYKKEDVKNYKEVRIDKYNLFIDETFQAQFQINDAPRSLTPDEAKNVFINSYGYTGIQQPDVDYEITINRTGSLTEDSNESIVQAVNDQTELCDRKAECLLSNYYEDTRKFFDWPDVQLTSGFFSITHEFEVTDPPEGAFDIGAWYYLSSDPNTYTMPLLPILNSNGQPAGISDLIVYLNGRKINNCVIYIDPWEGIVGLNFIPPFDSLLRIDYYYSKRYPDQIYYLKQVKGELPLSLEGDLPALLTVVNTGGIVVRLTWPFSVSNSDLYGDSLDYQMDKFPILNQRGELATIDEVDVQVGNQIILGTLEVINIDTSTNTSTLESLDSSLASVQTGDTIVITIQNYLDNTHIYVIESVDIITNTLVVPNLLPQLGAQYSYTIIRFTNVPGAVTDLRPLLGHIRINFLLPVNSYIRFNYYYTACNRNYLMMPDDYNGANYNLFGCTPDTVYSSKDRYTMLVDQSSVYADQPYWSFDELLKIGYRYRAFSLSNSSVLNSERLILNDYERYTNRASFNYGPSNLNRFGLIFSPEYLTDTDKNVILNDKYLEKDLPAETTLNPGIPIFAETYTDDGHYKNYLRPIQEDTYNPNLEGGKDLKASFQIIEPDDSGLVDYNSICNYEDNKKINLYSDLKIIEHTNDGYNAHLTTIEDVDTSVPFRFSFIERYYPNRELRITDYLDYINQVPTEYRTGEIKVLNKSRIIKSIEKDFRAICIGDLLVVEDIPFIEGGTTVYKNIDYVIIEILDFETARINKPFKGPNGQYDYNLIRSKTYAVDTFLGGGYVNGEEAVASLNRTLVLKNSINFTYGLPELQLAHYTSGYSINFSDPDVDPYPRNPDNQWLNHPSVSYFDIEPVVVDGETYLSNRTLGVTGIILSSDIVDAEGHPYGATGAGETGPSGALNLGITGPVEYADPRAIDDYDVYQVPSGDSGMFFSYSEAEYRVQWRNWDQELLIVNLDSSGIIEEDPINMLDDIGDNIMIGFWKVSTGELVELRFSGTVIQSTETIVVSSPATTFPEGMILLNIDQIDAIRRSSDPVSDFPEYHLNDTNYKFNKLLIRELRHDNLMNVTEVNQFIPIV